MQRIPEIFEEFTRDFPDAAEAFQQLGDALHSSGPLDARARRLVKLGIAVGTSSEGGVRSQVRKALAEGFSRAEIEHAILPLAASVWPLIGGIPRSSEQRFRRGVLGAVRRLLHAEGERR